jgi:hypothetical protein
MRDDRANVTSLLDVAKHTDRLLCKTGPALLTLGRSERTFHSNSIHPTSPRGRCKASKEACGI